MSPRPVFMFAVTVLMLTTCAPDEALEHPCLEGSSLYSNCEPVEIGGSCSDDEQCKGELAECVAGKCECQPTCLYKSAGDDDGCGGCCAACLGSECGVDGCGVSCGECGPGDVCKQGKCIPSFWVDFTTDLDWENPPEGGSRNCAEAKQYCEDLPLDGGGWRLPTIGEVRTVIRGCSGTVTGGNCKVADSCLSYGSCWSEAECGSCPSGAGPADGCYWPDNMQGTCSWYWSSSPLEDGASLAWGVNFGYGYVVNNGVGSDRHVRCVR